MSKVFVTHPSSGLVVSIDSVVASDHVISEITSGRYEAQELDIATRFISPDDRVLELGAGVGFISSGVMRHVRPSTYVAVEADARLIPHIEETHRRNGISGVTVIQAAFSTDETSLAHGSVTFRLHREFWRSGIGQTQEGSLVDVEVPTRDASAFIADHRITALIADIEGAELDLLRNLRFGGLRKILLELHPQHFGRPGVQEIFSLLMQAGYTYSTEFSAGSVVCFEGGCEAHIRDHAQTRPARVAAMSRA